MNKNNFILLTLIIFTQLKPVDPLSRIEITSDKAIAQKKNESLYLSYIGNVKAKLADLTTADADKLKVEINSTKNKKEKTEKLKEIILEGNVFIEKENLKINSDKAIIYPSQKRCNLSGNIIIEQTKKKDKDLPIITKCNFATLNLITKKLELQGSKTKPINTIIKLGNHPKLENNKPSK